MRAARRKNGKNRSDTVETARAVRTRPWISAPILSNAGRGESSSELKAATAAVAVAVAVRRKSAVLRLAGKLKSFSAISCGRGLSLHGFYTFTGSDEGLRQRLGYLLGGASINGLRLRSMSVLKY